MPIMPLSKYQPALKLILFSIFASYNLIEDSINQPTFAETIIPIQIETENKTLQTIYVNPNQGNDQVGQGTANSPLKTITQALMVASPQTLIILAEGKYSIATGEKFPLVINQPLTIKGNPQSQGRNVIIEGNGFYVSRTAAGQDVAITESGALCAIAVVNHATIQGITVSNSHPRGHGMWVESANPTIINNTFTGNGNTGLSVNGVANPQIKNNLFRNNVANGILTYDTSKPLIENNTFQGNGFGLTAARNSQPIIINNSFRGNSMGIMLEGESQATLRQNQILDSTEVGLITISSASVDLGNQQESGKNVFGGNRLFDIKNSTNNLITAVGNQIYGKTSGKVNLQGTYNLASTSPSPTLTPSTPIANSRTSQPVSISVNPSTSLNSNRIRQTSTSNLPPQVNSQANNSQSARLNSASHPQPKPNIPPLPTKTPAREVITISGNLTPKRPLSNGNNAIAHSAPLPAIASNQVLPEPPVVSEPYRKPEPIFDDSYTSRVGSNSQVMIRSSQINNRRNINSNSKYPYRKPNRTRSPVNNNYIAPEPVSISPFDQTPTDESSLTEPRTISLNPNSINRINGNGIKGQSNQSSPANSSVVSSGNANSTPPRYVNSRQKRRTLTDILVFAPSSNQSNVSSQGGNNNSSLQSNNSATYKVIVSASDSIAENQVKSLYPNAFRTNYQGKSFLQVGLFSSRENAEQVLNSLRSYGLNPIIIP